MAELFTGLDPRTVRANLEQVRERIAAAGRDPGEVEICAATKYVPAEELPALAEAGVTLVGENRAQDLAQKQELHGELFDWDFIGALQSRKLKDIAPRVRLIHSIASESALRRLERHPASQVLIEVNVAGEQGKAGIDPAELAAEHGLERLSMGTSQDYEVAVEEGATIVRLGTALYR